MRMESKSLSGEQKNPPIMNKADNPNSIYRRISHGK